MTNHSTGLLGKLLSPLTRKSKVLKKYEAHPDMKWVVETTGRIHDSSPAIANGTVYTGTWGEHLYAINSETGDIQWVNEREIISTGPIVIEDTVYYSIIDDSQLHAVDAETGNHNWTYTASDVDNDVRITGPSGYSDTVYVGVSELGNKDKDRSEIHAVNTETGTQKWEKQVRTRVGATLTVTESRIFVAGDKKLYSLDPETGNTQWIYDMPGESNDVWPSAAVANGNVYVGTDYDGLCAVDAETGEELWNAESVLEENTGFVSIDATPTVAGDTIYLSIVSFIVALDADTGEFKWKYKMNSYVKNTPTVADGVVFVPSWDNHLRGIDAETGELLWDFEAPDYVSVSPTVSDGVLYVASEGPGTDHGYVYALEPDILDAQVESEDTTTLYGTKGHHNTRRHTIEGTDSESEGDLSGLDTKYE